MIQTEGAPTISSMCLLFRFIVNTKGAPGQDPAYARVTRDTFFITEGFSYFYSVFKIKRTWNYHIGFTD